MFAAWTMRHLHVFGTVPSIRRGSPRVSLRFDRRPEAATLGGKCRGGCGPPGIRLESSRPRDCYFAAPPSP